MRAPPTTCRSRRWRMRDDIERCSILDQPPFVEIRTSEIPNAGLGAFAATDIPIHTRLGQYKGVLLSEADAEQHPGTDSYFMESTVAAELPLPVERQANQVVRSALERGDRCIIIDGFDRSQSSWTRFMNSSNTRSAQNVQPRDLRNGYVVFHAAHNIKKGDELLYFYGRKRHLQNKTC